MEVSIPGLIIPLYRMGEYNIYSRSRLEVFPHFPQGKLRGRGRRENCLARKKRDACHWLGIFKSARLFRLTYYRWGKEGNSRSLFLNKKKGKRLFEWVYISIILSSPFTLTLGQHLRRFPQVLLFLHYCLYCGLDSLNCPWPGNRAYTWSSFEGLMRFDIVSSLTTASSYLRRLCFSAALDQPLRRS